MYNQYKKTVLLLILAIGLLSFNQRHGKGSKEKLTENELGFIKENYNWNSEEVLMINFRSPGSSCHYDNYRNLKKSSEWWTEFYSDMELVNVRNIFVYSDNKKAQKIIDSNIHFADINSFFLNNFFSRNKTCYGILVINKKGEFQKKAGEYTQEHIVELLKNLE